MKDEIKEIIDRFEFVKKEPNKLSYYPEDLLTREEMWLLYDYTTNLQEENKRLKDKLNIDLEWAKRCDDLFIERNNYKLRNKKAIEYIKTTPNIDGYINHNAMMYKLLDILQGEENDN